MSSSIVSQSSDDVYANLVKIIGDYGTKSIVMGTGFFVSKEYCVTCHHVIYRLEKLQIQYRDKIYDAEWAEEISNPERDIAVLHVIGCDAKPMIVAGDSFAGMKVKGCGFSHELLESLPSGKWFEGELSNLLDTQFNSEEIRGNNRWNKKPAIRLRCHQLDSRYPMGAGMSGSPICYYDDYRIIGALMSINKGEKYEGYVIPVKAILECVQKGQPVTAPSQTKSTEVLLTEGNRYFLQNQFDLALQQYDKIINDTNYLNALNNKGKALEKLGRYQEAAYCYQMATNINSQTSLSWYNKGHILHREGKFNEALECYNEALRIDPSNATFLYDKSLTLTYIEKYQEAIESCNKALEIDPNNARVWNSKGYALYKQGKLDDALFCSEKAVDVSPYDSFMSAWSLNTKGLILLEMNKQSEALDSFNKSTQLTPNWYWSWYNKGRVYHKLGELGKALDCYGKAYQYKGLYPSAYNLLKESIISLASEILTKNIKKWKPDRKKLLVKLANEFDKELATAILNKL